MFIREDEMAFWARYYKQLEGGVIGKTGFTDDGFPFFAVKLKDGTEVLCEISQDPEGNGPGFLHGLPDNNQNGG